MQPYCTPSMLVARRTCCRCERTGSNAGRCGGDPDGSSTPVHRDRGDDRGRQLHPRGVPAHRLNAGIFFGPFEANPFLPELYAAGHLASPELALRVELTIKELHLNELSRAFDAAFDRYPGPMLCLDADTFDVFNPQHVDQLTDTVRHLAAERTPR